MSWHETMHVMLTPDWVGYHIRSPLHWAAGDQGFVTCAPDDPAQPWTAACAALSELMSEQMRRGVRLSVILSDRFARYQMLPWQPGIASRAECRAFAMHSFQSVYGDAVKTWRVKIELVSPGRPSLACAVDSDLIEALRVVAAANSSRLVEVRPNFVRLFGQRRQALRGENLWFGAVESHHISLGVLAGGNWQAIRNEAAAAGWMAALPGLVRRIQVGLNEPHGGTLYLCGDIHADAAPQSIGGLPVQVLEIKPLWGRTLPDQPLSAEG